MHAKTIVMPATEPMRSGLRPMLSIKNQGTKETPKNTVKRAPESNPAFSGEKPSEPEKRKLA